MSENAGRYERKRQQIERELEGLADEAGPSIRQLWNYAEYQSESAASWMSDMPPDDDEVQTAKSDVLKALVALEMVERRYQDTDSQTDP